MDPSFETAENLRIAHVDNCAFPHEEDKKENRYACHYDIMIMLDAHSGASEEGPDPAR